MKCWLNGFILAKNLENYGLSTFHQSHALQIETKMKMIHAFITIAEKRDPYYTKN